MRTIAILSAILAAPAAFPISKDALCLIDPEARAIFGVNVARASESPSWPLLLTLADRSGQRFLDVRTATGLDIKRDLQEVIIVSRERSLHRGVVLLRGSFDAGRAGAFDRTGAEKVEDKYNGVRIFRTRNETPESIWTAVLPEWLVIGPAHDVRAALDRYRNAQQRGAWFETEVLSASGRFDAWSIVRPPSASEIGGLATEFSLSLPQTTALSSILHLSAGIRLGASVFVEGNVSAASPEHASALAATGNLMLNAVRMEPRQTPVPRLSDRLQLSAIGSSAVASIVLDLEEFYDLLPGAVF